MPGDKQKIRPHDSPPVNVHEDYEAEYWTRKLGVTRAELEAAVKKVGVMAKDVE
jgi:hypothetical protein